jgi:hypothetical protein
MLRIFDYLISLSTRLVTIAYLIPLQPTPETHPFAETLYEISAIDYKQHPKHVTSTSAAPALSPTQIIKFITKAITRYST